MNNIIAKTLELPFKEAIEKVKQALASEGFGVITEINVKDTLKKKLDIDYENYIILGACNPKFAHEALETDKNVGILLPCNVILFENDKGTITVSTIRPTHMLNILNSTEVCKVGADAEKALEQIFDKLI